MFFITSEAHVFAVVQLSLEHFFLYEILMFLQVYRWIYPRSSVPLAHFQWCGTLFENNLVILGSTHLESIGRHWKKQELKKLLIIHFLLFISWYKIFNIGSYWNVKNAEISSLTAFQETFLVSKNRGHKYFEIFWFFTKFFFCHEWNSAWLLVIKAVCTNCLTSCPTT